MSSLSAKLAGCVLFAIVLNGCTILQKLPHQPAVVTKQASEPDKGEKPPHQPTVVAKQASEPDKREVRLASIILLSGDIPAYQSVADELVKKIGEQRSQIYLLDNNPDNTVAMLNSIRLSNYHYVVAIGLPAVRAVNSLENKSIIFCQVLSYQQSDLVGPNTRGVRMIPPLSMQLSAWNMISPNIKRVGIITGSDTQDLIVEAQQDASKLGIELIHKTVASDKQFLYEFKRFIPLIDGLLLVPDNRILSHRVIRSVMRYSNKHNIQVLGFDPQLLKLGALLSVTNHPADVADQVINIIESDTLHASKTGILSLAKMRLHINSSVAKQFGLNIPPSSPALVYAAWPDIKSRKSP